MIIDKQVKCAKEVDEAMDLFVALVKNRKAGDPLGDLMDELVKALSGLDQVDDEWKADRKAVLETVGSKFGALVDAFVS